MELHPGDKVDRYVLSEQLGEGGQGAVWKADDPLHPGQPRALKLVPVVASRPNDVERVRREARALSKLSHPSLVECHGLFEDLKAGVVGVVMDFVDGTSLRGAERDGRLGAHHRMCVLRHVARVLAYLHGEGVIHRDLKLDNVLVKSSFFADPDAPENVKVVDLGIAAVKDTSVRLTALGTVVGTVAYLAPELLDPATFGADESAAAIDVFAFGVLGWLLLTGEHPTGVPGSAQLVDYVRSYREAAEKPSWPPAAPEGEWGELLRDCLKVRQADRIRDGGALSERVESLPSPSIVVRPKPEAALEVAPTSVATPGAMRDVTAASPALSERPKTSNIGPVARAAAPEPASKGRGLALGLLGGVTAIGLGVVLLVGSGRDDRPLPPASSSAPTPIESEKPRVVPSAMVAGDAGADADADADAAPAALPAGCDADSGTCDCCPSGTECKTECAAPLPADRGWKLRLAEMPTKEKRPLIREYPTGEVCVKLSNVETYTCTALTDLVDGGTPSDGLFVTTQDLTTTGFDVRVSFPLVNDVPSPLASAEKVVIAAPTQALLCKGITVETSERNVPVESVRFFLDPAEPEAPPARKECP